jgi:hypothetical protein
MSKQIYTSLILFLAVILTGVAHAQTKRYPANINPIIGLPYSVFLNDYSTPGTSHLSANVVFNDFNEPSWNFRLRIKIESANVRIETAPGYRPLEPITLQPGVLKTLTGSDWEDYFNYNNLVISGVSLDELVRSGGKLPEGFYSFCFQVLDYDTGEPLSEQTCQTAWLKLSNPPRLNIPQCGISLDPKLTQHPFSWQLFDATSPNAIQDTQFQLTIWEITDLTANPMTAVANGQALQIFQSDFLNEPTYLYSLSDPPFEFGKRYIYRVQAIDPSGKDKFKNQGYSEFCHFYYGWPVGGTINLLGPTDGGGFRRADIPTFNWTSVTNQLPGQNISYELTVVPIQANQSPDQAILMNDPWYQENTQAGVTTYNRSLEVDRRLGAATKYAWQVKAYTDQIEVAKSEIKMFNGPALMENFWAGIHRVAVDYLNGTDLNDMSGGGRIRFKNDANAWTNVTFEHIQLLDDGEMFLMTGGEFFYTPPQATNFEFLPDLKENSKAYFDLIRYRVDPEGIFVEGSMRWKLPFASQSTSVANVVSESKWMNYNNFLVNGYMSVAEKNQFKLLEPLNVTLDFSTTGMFYIIDGQYHFNFNGDIVLPDKITGTIPGLVRFPFINAEQMFYIDQDGGATVLALNKSKLKLASKHYILDLSEQRSPEKFQTDPRWKGIYIEDFDIIADNSFDGGGQFDVVRPIVYNLKLSGTDNQAWISTPGLNLKFDISYPDSSLLVFQTFPSSLRRLKLTVANNEVDPANSFLRGDLLIPVFSTQTPFGFNIPINNIGFQEGSLDNITNSRFTFNQGSGDQEIKLTIKRAVLSSHEKVAMTVDLEWPGMGVTLNDLRGFNAWGDYAIGFDNKNGTVPLVQRMNASLSGYPITIGVIGAGSNDGNYVFATTADAGLGDDVSGGSGVPSINVYSVSANKFVAKGASGAIVEDNSTAIPFEQAASAAKQDFTTLQQNLAEKAQASQQQMVSETESLKNGLAASSAVFHTADEMVVTDGQSFPAEIGQGGGVDGDSRFNARQKEIIHDIAAGFVEELAKPLTKPIKDKTDSLALTISNAINKTVDKINATVETKVTTVIKALTDKLAGALKNDKVPIEAAIKQMGDETAKRITLEIKNALSKSANDNIITPVNILLKDQVAGRINKYITDGGTKIVYTAITGNGASTEDAMKELVSGVPGVMKDVLKDVAAFVSLDNVESTIEATASGLIKNINLDLVAHDLRKTAEDIIKQAINDKINETISNLAANYADDLGLGGFGVGGENPIDFVGVAQRFKEGGIKGVFAVDRVQVKLRTPVIDLDGFMSYTPKHPTYGDVWLGDIDMTIKVPKKFAFNAIYFNGRKDDVSYWFCQITPPGDTNEPYQLGKPLSKHAKALEEPVNIGVAKIVGAAGRLYHHMSENGQGIIPDPAMAYGAYMHFIFFDKNNDGENLRLEVSGGINAKENGDYTIEFDGNLQLRSPKPQILEIDTQAAVQGTVLIRYNSAEEHFFGYAKIIVQTKALCAQASLLVDVKPGHWRVAIGSREERIIFVPGCAGWSPTGWLDLNESIAELGLGIQYSVKAGFDVDLGVVDIGIDVNAGFAFGIQATVQYKPSFALMSAGVWVDIWANVVAHYKFFLGSRHDITLVDIFIRGDLVMTFIPSPTNLEGNLNGHVKILSFGIDFKAHFKKELG